MFQTVGNSIIHGEIHVKKAKIIYILETFLKGTLTDGKFP